MTPRTLFGVLIKPATVLLELADFLHHLVYFATL
jgi:hypothetical protein